MGVFFLTREALKSPWLAYEAGGIAAVERRRVYTVLVGIEHSEVPSPLGQFQWTKLDKSDLFKLVKDINSRQTDPLSEVRLEKAFEREWPDLEKQFPGILSLPSGPDPEPVQLDKILTSVLSAMQSIEARLANVEGSIQVSTKSQKVLRAEVAATDERVRRLTEAFQSLEDYLLKPATVIRTRPGEVFATGHSAASFAARGVAPTSGIGDLSIGQVGTIDTAMPIGSPLTLTGMAPSISVDPATGNLSLNPSNDNT